MKLHLASAKDRNSFTGYGPGYVAVNGVSYRAPLVVTPDSIRENWPASGPHDLTAEQLALLLDWGPEIILLGTGARQQFPAPAVLRPLYAAGIGVEIMDTPAACRTYNILSNEARKVLAAMWLP